MKPKKLIAKAKLAWLGEIGVDTHWLGAADGAIKKNDAHATTKTAKSADNQQLLGNQQSPAKPKLAIHPKPTKEVNNLSGSVPNVALNIAELDSLDKLYTAIVEQINTLNIAARPVLGAGVKEQPRYMLIGEQPGLDDSAAGKPFAGLQADLLAAIFKAVQLPDADACFMTHLVKYRLPNGIEPDQQIIQQNLQYLKQEINLIRPQNIIALGRIAASALLNGADLKQLRGQMHYYKQANQQQIPLWISHQPIALLVHGARKDQAWRDFVAIAKFNSL